jgi:flavin reductase
MAMASWQGSVTKVDSQAFRRVLGHFATGVTVVTTTVDGHAHGMTANAFTSLSLTPPLVVVCVDKEAKMHGFLERSGSFAVTILSERQRTLSAHFADPERVTDGVAQFDGLVWRPGPALGHPVLPEGLAYLECEVEAMHEGGDHSIVVGLVAAADVVAEDDAPLAYYKGGYRRIVTPGN